MTDDFHPHVDALHHVGKGPVTERFIDGIVGGETFTEEFPLPVVEGADQEHHRLGKCTLNPTRARGSFTFRNEGYDEEETHEDVIRFMLDGKLDAGVWLDLDDAYPLAEINRAFDAVRARRHVKALIRLRA